MAKVYTVAVAGLGKRGKVHTDLFTKNPRFDVVGVADVDPERVQQAAEMAGGAQQFDDAAKMLQTTKPDVFCFCTPPTLRYPMVKLGVDN